MCIPRAVVVIETADTVQFAVYYGLPDAAADVPVDNTVSCPTDASVTGSVLIPLRLAAPIGDRTVETLAEDPIREVTVPST